MCLLLLVTKKIKIFTNVITIQYIHSQEQIMRYFTCHPDNPIKYSICGQLISEDSFLHQKRILSEHVLIMVNDGTLLINSNNMCYSVSKGQYILLRANETHFGTNTSKGRLSYFWVHFTAQLDVLSHKKETNAENILFPEYGFFSINGLTTVLFNQLSDISFEDDKRSKLMCGYALNMLLLEISKENNSHKDNNSNDIPIAITSAMDWIYRNYYLQFSVSQLAQKYGYSPDYFSFLFKKSTNISLTSFINSVRIRSSKALLANFGVSIKEIAYSCGFSDEKYYMRVFKKSEGITPTQYRSMCGKSHINQF